MKHNTPITPRDLALDEPWGYGSQFERVGARTPQDHEAWAAALRQDGSGFGSHPAQGKTNDE